MLRRWVPQWPVDGVGRTDLVALPEILRPSLVRGLIGAAFRSSSERVFVLRGRPGAFAHVLAEPGQDHWLVARLVAPVADLQRGVDLVEAMAREAGARGVIRLHTLVPDDPELLEWWQGAGFVPFRRVLLLVGHPPAPEAIDDLPIRVQEAVDSWEVQRLYERVTPRPVQYAEARNRATWHVGRRGGWWIRGFLFDDDTGPRAYYRVRSRARRHVIEFLVSERALAEAGAFVRAVTARCARPGDEVAVIVPEDAGVTLATFEDAGFRPVEPRVWVARYTVRRLRAWKVASEAARVAALAETPRVLYRRERPEVVTVEH